MQGMGHRVWNGLYHMLAVGSWVTHTSLPMPLFPHLQIHQFLFLTSHSKASELCLGLAETFLQGQILKSSHLQGLYLY